MKPVFFEVACDAWARYLTKECGKPADPETFRREWKHDPETFKRAVGWSLARGFSSLRKHPEDVVRERRKAA